MSRPTSKLSAQGRISNPARVRGALGIGPGSVLEWEWNEECNAVVVRKVRRYSSEEIHRAVFGERPHPRRLETLRAAVRRHVREKHARCRNRGRPAS